MNLFETFTFNRQYTIVEITPSWIISNPKNTFNMNCLITQFAFRYAKLYSHRISKSNVPRNFLKEEYSILHLSPLIEKIKSLVSLIRFKG